MIYKKQQFGTFNLHTIKTDKFKTISIDINLFKDLLNDKI